MTTYEKRGAAIRIERVRGTWNAQTLLERGVARDGGSSFEAEPLAAGPVEAAMESKLDSDALRQVRESINQMKCDVVHAVATAGAAAHRFEGRSWESSEQHAHLTIRCSRMIASLHTTFAQLSRLPSERDHEAAISLSTHAVAQLARELFMQHEPMPFRQIARPHDLDGFGTPLEATIPPDRRPPNFFRPSYRYPPFRHPLGLSLDLPITVVPSTRLEVIALSSITRNATQYSIEGIAHDAQGGFRSVGLVIERDSLTTMQMAAEKEWFPLDGGTWGSRVLLEAKVQEI